MLGQEEEIKALIVFCVQEAKWSPQGQTVTLTWTRSCRRTPCPHITKQVRNFIEEIYL